MKTNFYLAGQSEPLAEAACDLVSVDAVLTINGSHELRRALDLAGETSSTFAVSQCEINKQRGEDIFQKVTIRSMPKCEPIDFAKLDQLIRALPDKYRTQSDSVFILPRPRYLFVCRRGRKNSRRTLYGLRRKARQQWPTRAKADKLARINFAEKPSLPPLTRESLVEVCLGSIAQSDLTELFPERRRKDRWMGDPDLFACCSGVGFHVTLASQIYCPCAAGFMRAELDRSTP